jgi:hypothetical protein
MVENISLLSGTSAPYVPGNVVFRLRKDFALFTVDFGWYMECYASCSGFKTLQFSFNAFGICLSLPSFLISPFHVRIPFARPCNPFTVNSNQLGRQRKWIDTLGLNSVTVKKQLFKPFRCQPNGCYFSSIHATNIRGEGGLGVRTTRCPTPLFSNAPRA